MQLQRLAGEVVDPLVDLYDLDMLLRFWRGGRVHPGGLGAATRHCQPKRRT